MTNQHPITPPPELVNDWAQKAQLLTGDDSATFAELLCNKAARWGADQELEACVNYIDTYISGNGARAMRKMRRSNPPSLKEQALEALYQIESEFPAGSFGDTIRRALEALPDS